MMMMMMIIIIMTTMMMMIKTDFLNRINHQYCSCQYSIFEDIPQNEPLRISLLKLFVLKGPVVTIKRVCGLD